MSAHWTSIQIFHTILGGAAALLLPSFLRFMFGLIFITVGDETAVLVTRFGRLVAKLQTPGPHFHLEGVLPWVKAVPVSLQRDFRHYREIHLNDLRGTTVIVDLWIEFRVSDPEKALYHIEDWEQSLESLLTHSATSILGTREFSEILRDRTELGRILGEDIKAETNRWGLTIENVFIRSVSLLPEISRQMFETVAARLERAMADVQEEGRLKVALLEAETSAKVAALVAEAKGQYPAAVGRAYAQIAREPEVFAAYRELYELSLTRPHRTVSFAGFADGEVRPMDAAMVGAPTPPLSSSEDHPIHS